MLIAFEVTFEAVFIFFLSFLGHFFENHVLCGFVLLRGGWIYLGVLGLEILFLHKVNIFFTAPRKSMINDICFTLIEGNLH